MITTAEQFNTKYAFFRDVTGNDLQGMIDTYPSVVMYMDTIFQDLTKIEGFTYSYIGSIRGIATFRNSLPEIMPQVGRTVNNAIEERLNFLLTLEREIENRKQNETSI